MKTKISSIICAASLSLIISGCATASRGTTTLFMVETTPVGAKVMTNLETKNSKKTVSTSEHRQNIKDGKTSAGLEFHSCEPTPCGIEVPRKYDFDVMVVKDGYTPVLFRTERMHHKKIQKETAKNTALAAGASAAGTAAVGAGIASSLGTTVSGGAMASGMAVMAAPALLIGAVALGVDSGTGANYDFYPNPVPLALVKSNNEEEEAKMVRAFETTRVEQVRERKKYEKKCRVEAAYMKCSEVAAYREEQRRKARGFHSNKTENETGGTDGS